MSYKISYQERAIKEYESAAEWYSERSEQAAISFEEDVMDRIDLLRTQPATFKKTYKRFHEVSLKKYPFSIVYIINNKERVVVISSIFHHNRNPNLKYKTRK